MSRPFARRAVLGGIGFALVGGASAVRRLCLSRGAEAAPGAVRTYELTIGEGAWRALVANARAGRVRGCDDPADTSHCETNPDWNATAPAEFVHAGQRREARVRHQGSHYNRARGPLIRSWSCPGPLDRDGSVRALSWQIEFDRRVPFEGRRTLVLKKLSPGTCAALEATFGARLAGALGLPSFTPRIVAVRVNGCFYDFMMEWRETAEELMAAVDGPAAGGALFESRGLDAARGEIGIGDARPLDVGDARSSWRRYRATYALKSGDRRRSWEALVDLVSGLARAREGGHTALRGYLERTFDVDRTLSYLAFVNWSAAWDDSFHNHLLYLRPSGRWMLLPWDYDQLWKEPQSSIFRGEEGNPSNSRADDWNRIKDSFFRALRGEYVARVRSLAAGPLAPDAVRSTLRRALADLPVVDDPAWRRLDDACGLTSTAGRIEEFSRRRGAVIEAELGAPSLGSWRAAPSEETRR